MFELFINIDKLGMRDGVRVRSGWRVMYERTDMTRTLGRVCGVRPERRGKYGRTGYKISRHLRRFELPKKQIVFKTVLQFMQRFILRGKNIAA